jgi:hypothetical protein
MDKNPEEPGDNDIDNLINSALNLGSDDLQSFKSEKELRAKLKSIVSEYLDSFYIFGYDIDGNTILVKGANNDMQMDALDTLAMRLFVAGNIGTGYEQYK